ncbi:MAG: VOC family protein [Candidatus Thorarchaeota archaeon]
MTSICVICIYVNDIDQALDFYCNKLGFEVAKKYDDGCLVRLENEGPTLILEKVAEPSNAKYPQTSQVALGIETKNLEETANRLREMNIDFIYDAPQPFPAGTFMAIRDPSGNVLELLQFEED